MMMAPMEIVCSSMPSSFITTRLPSTVVGTMAPTIKPVRIPRNKTTTPMTITVVSRNTWLTCLSCWVTISAWSVIGTRDMPWGSDAPARWTSARSLSAKLTTLRPGAMDTAIATADCPLTNAPTRAGSSGTRSRRASWPKGSQPPPGSATGVWPSSW